MHFLQQTINTSFVFLQQWLRIMTLATSSRRSPRSRRIQRIFLVGILLIALLFVVNVRTVSAAGETEQGFQVTIEDALYTDLDGDGYEDDVFVYVRFDLGEFCYYEFAYIITLTLPSGAEYAYLVYVWAWADYVYTNNLFIDHATESGDYQVYVDAILIIPEDATDSQSCIFDPPGGSEGGPPAFHVY